MSECETKKIKGGGGSTMNNAKPISLSSALFSYALTYSFLSNVSRLTIVILDCLDVQLLSCLGDLVKHEYRVARHELLVAS